MEDPCHSGMLRTFLDKGCRIVPVPADAMGLDTRRLPAKPGACAVYVTPWHQFPLGGILPASRRAALIRYARDNGLYVIEDDYDSEYRYAGDPVAPLYRMDPQRVIYVGTFIKVLFPAQRIGYVIHSAAPQKAVARPAHPYGRAEPAVQSSGAVRILNAPEVRRPHP
jgi:GntR family transcriptional regulator/MocR family aminotransferase